MNAKEHRSVLPHKLTKQINLVLYETGVHLQKRLYSNVTIKTRDSDHIQFLTICLKPVEVKVL